VKHITFILLVDLIGETVDILKKNKNIAYLLLLYTLKSLIYLVFLDPYQGINDIAFFLPTSKSLCGSQVGTKM
jgi:hypothetical protein